MPRQKFLPLMQICTFSDVVGFPIGSVAKLTSAPTAEGALKPATADARQMAATIAVDLRDAAGLGAVSGASSSVIEGIVL
jgi:hypothetical protein